MSEVVEVKIYLRRSPDGGVRVSSETLPGLILSGPDQDGVLECIGPAIKCLLEHKGKWPDLPAAEQEAAYLATLPEIGA